MRIDEFLLARIAEDEAEQGGSSAWHLGDCERNTYNAGDCDCGLPARVLAECKAKRRVVELRPLGMSFPDGGEDSCAGVCAGGCCDYWVNEGLCETLKLLAGVYADHADYEEAWRFAE